jgi:hypothetical protein
MTKAFLKVGVEAGALPEFGGTGLFAEDEF